MNIQKVKELVLSNKLAIENDSTVEKLNEVLKYCFPDYGLPYNTDWVYYFNDYLKKGEWWFGQTTPLPTIKLSEITFNIFKDQVIELRKQYPNDIEFGGEVSKILNQQ